jgi:hypothetical protein
LRALTPGRRWHLTGSGGALFCVCGDRDDARTVVSYASAQGFAARACEIVSG